VRAERRPVLIEAITYRFRGHSMADPESYRSKDEVAAWRERDPIPAFGRSLLGAGMLDEQELAEIDAKAMERIDAAVAFADQSPFPAPESLYDDIYVLGDSWRGWYSVETTEERSAGAEADGAGAANDEIPQQLTSALAAGEDAGEPAEASG